MNKNQIIKQTILGVIIVVALISGGIYQDYSHHKNNVVSGPQSIEQNVASTEAQYQLIPEWGLKYKITPENKDIYYKIEQPNPYNSSLALDLYSKKLSDLQQLGATDYYKVIILRKTTDPRINAEKDINPERVRKIGDYFYWDTFEAQSPCPHYDSAGHIDEQADPICSAELNAENAVFQALEAIK